MATRIAPGYHAIVHPAPAPPRSAHPAWPVLWCLAAAALFASSTPASKVLLEEAPSPPILAGLLYLGAGLTTLPLALRAGTRRVDPANARRLAGAVVFGGVLGPVALLAGLALAPSASVSLWLNLETTATAALGWALFKENVEPRTWAASGLVVVAGALLASPGGFVAAPSALLVLLACVCWGIDNNLTAVVDGATPAQTTAAKGLVAGAVNLAVGLALGGALPGWRAIGAALAVGSLAYGVSIALYIRGAQQLGATRSQMIFATAPFLGMGGSWIALGEKVLGAQAVAAVLMAGALGLLFTGRHSHPHAHAPTTHTHTHRHDDGHHDHHHPDAARDGWHTHEHAHDAVVHDHPHAPDLHHRHH